MRFEDELQRQGVCAMTLGATGRWTVAIERGESHREYQKARQFQGITSLFITIYRFQAEAKLQNIVQ